jgi:hypothetical protein
MVVAVPQEHAATAQHHAGLGGALRRIAEADDVVAADRFVAPQKLVAAPFAGEDAFGGAALYPGPGIELAPAGQRRRHDLDAMLVRIAYDLAIAFQRRGIGAHHGHVQEPHACGNGRMEIVDDDLVHHAAWLRSSPASARSIRRTTLSRP